MNSVIKKIIDKHLTSIELVTDGITIIRGISFFRETTIVKWEDVKGIYLVNGKGSQWIVISDTNFNYYPICDYVRSWDEFVVELKSRFEHIDLNGIEDISYCSYFPYVCWSKERLWKIESDAKRVIHSPRIGSKRMPRVLYDNECITLFNPTPFWKKEVNILWDDLESIYCKQFMTELDLIFYATNNRVITIEEDSYGWDELMCYLYNRLEGFNRHNFDLIDLCVCEITIPLWKKGEVTEDQSAESEIIANGYRDGLKWSIWK